ncbi:MAG: M15 family metallopeptidase [Nitriliruptoraceae bacterium]
MTVRTVVVTTLAVTALTAVALTSAPEDAAPPSAAPPAPAPTTVDTGDDVLPDTITKPGGLVVRRREPFTPGELSAIAALNDVEAIAPTESATLGLTATVPSRGRQRLSDGFHIPLSALAVDPPAYATILASIANVEQSDVERLTRLVADQALQTATGHALRPLEIGDTIIVGGSERTIAGVVDDVFAPSHEIVVHADGAQELGFASPSRLLVQHRSADVERLRAHLTQFLPDEGFGRIDNHTAQRRAPLVLGLAELKHRFGEFAYRPRPGQRTIDIDPQFVDDHIVTTEVPVLGRVTCHRGIIDDLRAALAEVVDAELTAHLRPDRYGGCFVPRMIDPDGHRLSHHAWGIAIDINVDLSAPGLGPVPPEEMIAAFARHGFRWGGTFSTPDNHHFEWVGAAAQVRRARRAAEPAPATSLPTVP